jgi:hypothetical protein
MKRHWLNRKHRRLIAGAMFLALLSQSLIPAGFMPASDGSFALQVCHSGFPTQSGSEQGAPHSGSHSHVEFCSFGALPGAGPISYIAAPLSSQPVAPHPVAEVGFRLPSVRLARAHLPRGPPTRLILA